MVRFEHQVIGVIASEGGFAFITDAGQRGAVVVVDLPLAARAAF